jgi:hypothetical protein
MAKEIIITIHPDGSTEVEADGFAGQECLAATDAFERALGMEPEREFKPEFMQEAKQDAGRQQSTGG